MVDWNIVSAVAAALATFISLFALSATQSSQKRMERPAARQDRLAHKSWTDGYFRDIAVWASDVCTAISEAIHLVGVDDPVARRGVLTKLSAGIDMGRWYLPNAADGKSTHKEPAYRGSRQPALDWIVRAYNICHRPDRFDDPHRQLVICQRNFVSAVQEIIDPRSREASIHEVLDSFAPVADLPKVESPLEPDKSAHGPCG